MKLNVLDTMRYKGLTLLALIFCCFLSAQAKYEREFRIKTSQFPQASLEVAEPFMDGVRKLRFYKEIDSSRQSYEIKFKRGRLKYSVEFSDKDVLEDIEVGIAEVDIPKASFQAIEQYLEENFTKYKIRKIQQQYPRTAFASTEETFRNAFQNLILPEIRYELMVHAKTTEEYMDFEILFDSEGQFLNQRKSLPPNYDHVLY
ncbi:MAG: hypothetical protein WBM56_08880 [Robiginitalea sp.]|uniref:hypothetical protein n=1 Tax=Robiginitalea sp. TaxID=1902411 RepID=UPI003C740379